jgi:16S rRNA (uracil1498-N3)-methyltransferase
MPRRRFFVPPDRIREGNVILTSEEAHHLRHVLRLRAGCEVELFDGAGGGYAGTLEVLGSVVRVVGLRELKTLPQSSPSLTLAFALIRSEKVELVLQKATELGTDEFVPLMTRYSNARIPAARLQGRLERWERILRESCKQCRRFTVPALWAPVAFEKFLSQTGRECAKFMLHEQAKSEWPVRVPSAGRVILAIGPEGGWDFAEVQQAALAGWSVFRMGDTILRAETAAIAAVTLFRFGSATH